MLTCLWGTYACILRSVKHAKCLFSSCRRNKDDWLQNFACICVVLHARCCWLRGRTYILVHVLLLLVHSTPQHEESAEQQNVDDDVYLKLGLNETSLVSKLDN